MKSIKLLLLLVIHAVLLLPPTFVSADELLRIAITTTTESSGIARVLNKSFTEQTGIRIHTVIHGSGQALRTAKDGNVDVVMAHAPELEKTFIDKGWGIERKPVMQNDFVIVGPIDDPADVKNSKSAAVAFGRIAESEQRFVSRNDISGTHIKENLLWRLAGVSPEGNWYIPAGAGMGKVLTMADNIGAYTLCDRGTYLAFKNRLALVLLYEGDEILYNPYHIMIVNPDKHPHTKINLARKYMQFITGEKGQQIISDYRINGKRAFNPGVIEDGNRTN
ncbi:MAG TPA: substrate-binding domain-containing protein [Gammaproteobacteria bacterium]|nr:substrate-binding domain-containing protein [Gammaproteobacteria bacterium]